jgi:N-carbamoyl-L-amino-acid hydrolase
MAGARSTIRVNAERIRERVERLAQMTDPGVPYTRRAFTPIYQDARDWLAAEFRSAGLEPRTDAGGNLLGIRVGRGAEMPALALGSHIDTVPGGGRFDGIAGVVAALEAAQALEEAGVELEHPVWVIDFLSEEPSDYGASCVGSRAMAGTLSDGMLEGKNPLGEPLAQAIERMGGDPARLSAPLVPYGAIAGFMELHIEQGPVLERLGKPIGVVEGIVAIHRLSLTVEGEAGHAGTTPMHLRHDALVAAAGLVEQVSAKASDWALEEHFVATVGRFDVRPNAANVVPGAVEMILEARALDDRRVERFLAEVSRGAREMLASKGARLEIEPLSTASAVHCDDRIQQALAAACQRRGHDFERMSSGAGHDAMQVANLAPVGMIFIPCKDGISHTPAEVALFEHIAAGAEVLAEALVELDDN